MRNIVFQIGFDPTYASYDPIGTLRRGLYPFLTPKMRVEMRFISSNFDTVKIIGYVESFESSIFSAEPEIQISVLCPDPYFSSLAPVVASRVGDGSLNFTNQGTVESGLILTVNGITMPNVNPEMIVLTRLSPTFDFMTYSGPLYESGYALTIQMVTIQGSKSAGSMHQTDYNPNNPFDGVNLLGYIDKWLNVLPGSNSFVIGLPAGSTGTKNISVSYSPRFVGL